ncbi:DUF192 domain-containing protein [Oceanobacillus salinisoli]|uniref:DUF192 domain-containing protein n=1 Tax=Oceanobacillus salinisoli TaxID=2678611 RepID=UPI001E33869F|nr:DUF192 domain-containing protein [Oceanobacillus salinisoli]
MVSSATPAKTPREVQEIKLICVNTDTIIAVNVKEAYSFFSRFKGLMLKKSMPENSGLHIMPCSSIHTFFMKFSIDILYLNQNNEIVGMEEGLDPGKIGKRIDNTKSVIELPAGTIKRTSVAVGQKIALQG